MMEIFLNLAWALCSLGLIWFWMRSCASRRNSLKVSFHVQLLAVAMIVLLLLPVISLSDDLAAMQGPTETDTCVRRALHVDEWHPSVMPSTLAMPEREFAALMLARTSLETVEEYRPAVMSLFESRALDSRPPPAV